MGFSRIAELKTWLHDVKSGKQSPSQDDILTWKIYLLQRQDDLEDIVVEFHDAIEKCECAQSIGDEEERFQDLVEECRINSKKRHEQQERKMNEDWVKISCIGKTATKHGWTEKQFNQLLQLLTKGKSAFGFSRGTTNAVKVIVDKLSWDVCLAIVNFLRIKRQDAAVQGRKTDLNSTKYKNCISALELGQIAEMARKTISEAEREDMRRKVKEWVEDTDGSLILSSGNTLRFHAGDHYGWYQIYINENGLVAQRPFNYPSQVQIAESQEADILAHQSDADLPSSIVYDPASSIQQDPLSRSTSLLTTPEPGEESRPEAPIPVNSNGFPDNYSDLSGPTEVNGSPPPDAKWKDFGVSEEDGYPETSQVYVQGEEDSIRTIEVHLSTDEASVCTDEASVCTDRVSERTDGISLLFSTTDDESTTSQTPQPYGNISEIAVAGDTGSDGVTTDIGMRAPESSVLLGDVATDTSLLTSAFVATVPHQSDMTAAATMRSERVATTPFDDLELSSGALETGNAPWEMSTMLYGQENLIDTSLFVNGASAAENVAEFFGSATPNTSALVNGSMLTISSGIDTMSNATLGVESAMNNSHGSAQTENCIEDQMVDVQGPRAEAASEPFTDGKGILWLFLIILRQASSRKERTQGKILSLQDTKDAWTAGQQEVFRWDDGVGLDIQRGVKSAITGDLALQTLCVRLRSMPSCQVTIRSNDGTTVDTNASSLAKTIEEGKWTDSMTSDLFCPHDPRPQEDEYLLLDSMLATGQSVHEAESLIRRVLCSAFVAGSGCFTGARHDPDCDIFIKPLSGSLIVMTFNHIECMSMGVQGATFTELWEPPRAPCYSQLWPGDVLRIPPGYVSALLAEGTCCWVEGIALNQDVVGRVSNPLSLDSSYSNKKLGPYKTKLREEFTKRASLKRKRDNRVESGAQSMI